MIRAILIIGAAFVLFSILRLLDPESKWMEE